MMGDREFQQRTFALELAVSFAEKILDTSDDVVSTDHIVRTARDFHDFLAGDSKEESGEAA